MMRSLRRGLAYRRVASHRTLRSKGRAETNVGNNFVDTGDIAANSANHYAAEALLIIGLVSFLGKYIGAKVKSPTFDDPGFSGWYITGSWILPGATRPYDRTVGYA